MSRDIEENIPLNTLNNKQRKYVQIFRNCDRDNNGYLSLKELYDFINGENDGNFYVPKHKVRMIKRMSDKNGDGKLDQQEFIDMMSRDEFQYIMNRRMNRYVNLLVPPTQLSAVRTFRSVDEEEDEEMLLDQYSCIPPPLFFLVVSLLAIICFVTDELTEENSTIMGTGVTSKIFIFDPKHKEEIWRYLTYMLVHIGYQHIITNLIVQLLLGIPLEMVHKWWRVMIIYFNGVLAGCLLHSITEPNSKLGGASGGVYSIMAAHIANVIMNWSQMFYPYIQLLIFGILVSADLGPSVYQRYIQNIKTSVGVSAHLGGAIAGLLVGIYTLRNLKITRTEKYIWWGALILYIVLMTVAIVLNFIN